MGLNIAQENMKGRAKDCKASALELALTGLSPVGTAEYSSRSGPGVVLAVLTSTSGTPGMFSLMNNLASR